MNSKLSLIAVIGKNRELGKDNKLLWHIPGDLPRFKKITGGHPVIMGRKTFQSIGRPLPGRTNFVISRDGTFMADGVTSVTTLEDAITQAKKAPGSEEVFIIGGGSVYAQAIDNADQVYLTVVDKTAEADTFFPDYSQFNTVISEEHHNQDGFSFTYLTLAR
jgi:dihydrofolate reductase